MMSMNSLLHLFLLGGPIPIQKDFPLSSDIIVCENVFLFKNFIYRKKTKEKKRDPLIWRKVLVL